MRRRDPWLLIAITAFFILLFVALFGARIAPHEPIYFVLEHDRDPRPYDPGIVFPFGSDVLGRDLFSVVLAGAGATLAIVALGGLARVLAGVGLAIVAAAWPRGRLVADALAGLASAVPATLVALLVVKVFVKTDTSILVFIAALLVTGWAGPYRVIRAELDRLAHLGFTESASALGVRRSTIVVRHHLPHLVPLVSMNASQQIVASLVLLAELGVLGVSVGPVRIVNVAETLVRPASITQAVVSELSDWGGLLANSSARSVDSLWVTRWLFLIPGVAFAVTAVLVAVIGYALARRYARRNAFADVRGRGTAALALSVAAMAVISGLVPERYAAAREWADAARAQVRSTEDIAGAYADAGLRPLSASMTVERDTTKVLRSGPAVVRVGGVTIDDTSSASTDVRALVTADTGGGTVDAPLVFASRGLSPGDYPPRQTSIFGGPDLGTIIRDYADDYAGLDVRGKIVVLVRFMGVRNDRFRVPGADVGTAIDNALKRGAAAVLFIDPDLPRYVTVPRGAFQPVNPYARLEGQFPVRGPGGHPVVAVSVAVANRLLAAAGIVLTADDGWLGWDAPEGKVSAARDLRINGHLEVPLSREAAHVRSVVAEVPADPSLPRFVVWSIRRGDGHRAQDASAAVARFAAARRAPFLFVDFDPSVDPAANALQIRDVLKGREIRLIIVLDELTGSALKFTTPFGDLVPQVDLWADRAGARHATTRSTLRIDDWVWPGSAAYPDRRGVLVQATGGQGDLTADAVALIGYIAGRHALGAEELR